MIHSVNFNAQLTWRYSLQKHKTGNVLLRNRSVCTTIITVGKQYHIFWVSVCILRCSACNAHGPYCHLWPAWLCNIFPHYLITARFSGEKTENKVCALIFSKMLSELFLIQRDAIKCTFMWGIRHPCQILAELQFTQLIFEKYSNIKFNEILPVAGTNRMNLILFFVAIFGTSTNTTTAVSQLAQNTKLKRIMEANTKQLLSNHVIHSYTSLRKPLDCNCDCWTACITA
jgi:hypothetical protein